MTNGGKRSSTAEEAVKDLHYKKRLFLETFERLCVVGEAAKEVGIARQTVYDWIEKCPAFATAYKHAQKGILESLEKEAIRRARDGVPEVIFDRKGNAIGEAQRYSDVLLMFIMKAKDPQTYRERIEHTGEGGGPLEILVKYEGGPAIPDTVTYNKVAG